MKSQPQIKVQLSLPPAKVSFSEKLRGLWQLVRADKPVGVLLLFWPTLWALWIAAEGNPNWYVTLVFILGVLLIRSTGCAVKGYADRRNNLRIVYGCSQPVATGIVQPREAIAMMLMLVITVFFLLSTLSMATVVMSVVAVLLVGAYLFLRRFTYFSQIATALIIAWIVPLSFTAVDRELNLASLSLFLSAFVWVLIYEIEHAMAHRVEDMSYGVKTLAVFLNDNDVVVLAILQGLLLLLFFWTGYLTDRSWLYFTGTGLTALFFLRQQQLMRSDRTQGAFLAYLNNNCYGMTVFLIILGDYMLTR